MKSRALCESRRPRFGALCALREGFVRRPPLCARHGAADRRARTAAALIPALLFAAAPLSAEQPQGGRQDGAHAQTINHVRFAEQADSSAARLSVTPQPALFSAGTQDSALRTAAAPSEFPAAQSVNLSAGLRNTALFPAARLPAQDRSRRPENPFLAARALSAPESAETRTLSARGSDFRFYASAFADLRYGTINEYLYKSDGGEYKKISELDWDLKPVWYLGGTVGLSWRFLALSLSAAGSLPAACGSMEDSDWLDLTHVKNIYSVSEETVQSGFESRIRFGGNATLTPLLSLHPGVSAEYGRISIQAEDGYGWYGDADHSAAGTNVAWNSGYATFFPSGSLYGIDYTRSTFTAWTGAALEFVPAEFLSARFGIGVAPFSYTKAIDRHHGSGGGTYYLDKVYGVFKSIRLGLSLSCRFARHFSADALFLWTKTRKTKGKTYMSDSENGPYYRLNGYKGGVSGDYADISLALRFDL